MIGESHLNYLLHLPKTVCEQLLNNCVSVTTYKVHGNDCHWLWVSHCQLFSSVLAGFSKKTKKTSLMWFQFVTNVIILFFSSMLCPHPDHVIHLLSVELQSPQWSALLSTGSSNSTIFILVHTNRGGYDHIQSKFSLLRRLLGLDQHMIGKEKNLAINWFVIVIYCLH